MNSTNLYYLFTFLKYLGAGFTATVYVPLLVEDIGLTFAQVAMVNASFWATIILAELPTGMLADGRGRGWSISMGAAFGALAGFVFAFAPNVNFVILAEICAGISFAFFSGALTSWIADAPDRKEPLSEIYGRATMLRGVGSIIGVLITGQIAVLVSRHVGFMVFGAMHVALFFIARALMQGQEPEDQLKEFEALRYSAKHLRESPALRWVVALQFLFGAVVMFNLYWAPFALTKTDDVGLSFMWIPMYLSIVLAGWFVHRFAPKPGQEARAIVLGVILAALPLVITKLAFPLAFVVALFMVHELGRGAFPALTTAYVDHRVKPGYRATFQSLGSFIGSLGMLSVLAVASILLSGKQPDPELIPVIWTVAGSVMLLGVLTLWLLRPKSS